MAGAPVLPVASQSRRVARVPSIDGVKNMSMRPKPRFGSTHVASPTRPRSRQTATRWTISTSRALAPMKCSSIYSPTTKVTSRSIPPSKRISRQRGRGFSPPGAAGTTRSSCPAGAEAFRGNIPEAVIRFFDTAHFAPETHASEIAMAIRDFLHS